MDETGNEIFAINLANDRPTITWLKDGQRYLGNGRILNNADSIQLHIASVQREDQGMYQCLAFNDDDSAQTSLQLKIGG